jgi:TonB family protein
VYLGPLKAAGVEGRVTAQFVVDTSGHVDASSIRIVASDDERFSTSVRRALVRYRFSPAMAHGRKVHVRMQQEFVFRIAR